MTNCQNCGDEGDCADYCKNCGALIDPCGDIECNTCVEQFLAPDSTFADDDYSEAAYCPLCEGVCQGVCELAILEQEMAAQAKAEKERG